MRGSLMPEDSKKFEGQKDTGSMMFAVNKADHFLKTKDKGSMTSQRQAQCSEKEFGRSETASASIRGTKGHRISDVLCQ